MGHSLGTKVCRAYYLLMTRFISGVLYNNCASTKYLSRVCTVTHILSKKSNMDRPGKVVNPARRGQLNRENEYFPVRVRA